MTEVLQSSTSHFPSPSSSFVKQQQHPHSINPTTPLFDEIDQVQAQEQDEQKERKRREREGDHVSIAELLVAAFRRSIVRCSITAAPGRSTKELCKMEIGVPTDVRHVAHVTFDRFNGFLGLPVEFELEVPRRAPSASATVFGVSTASMQLSFDSRGNSVPTILLMMQRQLYTQGGLQAEGIFRITAGNSQEEYVRDQLNKGVVPEGIDVHCLAGLIKAWFRELPTGILDSLSPEQVMQSQSEEEFARLVSLLPATEAALLDWAINLMADVAQTEHLNKMNAHNIAMVFAPNMTQMSDPLTALMYVVQVMNFLKNLILRKLRERKESILQSNSIPHLEPSDGNGRPSSSQPSREDISNEDNNVLEGEKVFVHEEPAVESPRRLGEEDSVIESPRQSCEEDSASKIDPQKFQTSIENIPGGNLSLVDNCISSNIVSQVNTLLNEDLEDGFTCRSEGTQIKNCKNKNGQSSNSNLKKGAKKEQKMAQAAGPMEMSKATCILGSMNSRTELLEAWR